MCGAIVVMLLYGSMSSAQVRRTKAIQIAPSSLRDLREWDAQTTSMLRRGELRIRDAHDDAQVPRRTIERADQFYKGVRVFGGDIARQFESGSLVSVFGAIYTGIRVDTVADIDADRARDIVQRTSGATLADSRQSSSSFRAITVDTSCHGVSRRQPTTTSANTSSMRTTAPLHSSTASEKLRRLSGVHKAYSEIPRRSA
jgi:Zn-dependent metalloprotease